MGDRDEEKDTDTKTERFGNTRVDYDRDRGRERRRKKVRKKIRKSDK